MKIVKRICGILSKWKVKIGSILMLLIFASAISLALPFLIQKIIDIGFYNKDFRIILVLSVICIVLYIINAGIDILREKLRISIYADLSRFLNITAYNHLARIKYDYFSEKSSTEILECLNTDISLLTSIIDENTLSIISEIFCAIGGLIALFIISPQLTILIIGYIPIKYLVSKSLAYKNFKCMEKSLELNEEYDKCFDGIINGMREIRISNVVEKKRQDLIKLLCEIKQVDINKNMLSVLNIVSDTLFSQVLICSIYILGGLMIVQSNLTIGSVVAYLSFSMYVTAPLSAILNLLFIILGIVPSAKRFFEFIDAEEESSGLKGMEEIKEIVFDNVCFSYKNHENMIFNNVSFCIKKGEKIGIIGKNGVGKSTLINLLLRLYDSEYGKIIVNGNCISEYNIEEYRNKFSVVSQNVYLFDDSIKENVCFNYNYDEKKVKEVLEDVGLYQIILRDGLDYRIGINGSKLSGGQKQKIALARAILDNKEILIFDEATSNYDSESEENMDHLFEKYMSEKTVLWISHRDQMMNKMDKILEISNKNITMADNK